MDLLNKRGFAPILVIVVVTILGIGLFSLRNNVSKLNLSQNSLNQSPAEQTSNFLKTYKNTKYGFQFDYGKDSEIIYEGRKDVLLTIDYPKNSRDTISDIKLFTGGEVVIELVSKCNDYIEGTSSSGQVNINGKSVQVYDSGSNKGGQEYNTAVCLENNGNEFLLTNIYGPMVFGYDNPGTPEENITKNGEFFTQILNTFKFIPPGGKTDKTHTSNNLGIKFLYSPTTNGGENIIVKEEGNKVYVYIEGQDINNADYIEVVNTEGNTNIIDAMNQYLLDHFTKDDCFQVYNIQDQYPQGSNWELACGSKEGSLHHLDYFLYDKNNSKKFVFVNIDFMDKNGRNSSKNTAAVLTSDYTAWYQTISLHN